MSASTSPGSTSTLTTCLRNFRRLRKSRIRSAGVLALRTCGRELGLTEGIILLPISFVPLSVRCQSPMLDLSGDSQRRLEPASRVSARDLLCLADWCRKSNATGARRSSEATNSEVVELHPSCIVPELRCADAVGLQSFDRRIIVRQPSFVTQPKGDHVYRYVIGR